MQLEFSTIAPAVAFALAVVATVAYVLGKRATLTHNDLAFARRELSRANSVMKELETVSQTVRQSLATHHTSILQFKARVGELGQLQDASAWQELSNEAERMLKPTIQLSTQLAHAYDEIRQQANLLMTITESHTDALTGLSNRRALDDSLDSMLAMHARYSTPFAITILDIDGFSVINDDHGPTYGDQLLLDFAQLLDRSARQTDIVARFGGEEFVVVMPQTSLSGACSFAERFRARVQARLPLTISAGVTIVLGGDTLETLISRADTALYSAKSAGQNCVFQHCGQKVEPVEQVDPSAAAPEETMSDPLGVG